MRSPSIKIGLLLVIAALIIGSLSEEACRMGYLKLNDNNCYIIVLPTIQTFSSWAGASTFCALSGGKLATVTMSNKQELISRVPVNTSWFYYVDGNDIAQEGLWLRNKNQEVMLLKDPIWRLSSSTERNCAALWNGGFNDVKCDYVPNVQNSAYPFLAGVICEQV